MHCDSPPPPINRSRRRLSGAVPLAALAACGSPPAPTPAPAPVAVPRPAPPPAPAPAPVAPAQRQHRLQSELERYAAERIAQANAGQVYLGKPQAILLAVPVLRVDLNRDGSIRAISVLREPRQAKDTIQLAVAAVRRAAPFGDVSRLREPWMFVETFLFNDDRRFKPRGLE